MFLTAEAKPIDGGTYWPREDKKYDDGTARGFKTILKLVHDLTVKEGDGLNKQADHVAERTTAALTVADRAKEPVALDRGLVKAALTALGESYDKVHGGFGSPARNFIGTKFPTPTNLELLQYRSGRSNPTHLGNDRHHAGPDGPGWHLRSARRRLPPL